MYQRKTIAFTAAALACMLSSVPPAHAQDVSPLARNAVYAEIAGNALLYSINYDRRFQDNVTGRIGIMYASAEGKDNDGNEVDVDVGFIPLMMNLLVGGGSGRLELGAGPVFVFASGEAETLDEGEVSLSGFGLGAFSTTVGFRYQPVRGGFVFRASLTPFYSEGVQLWGGLSFGYAF